MVCFSVLVDSMRKFALFASLASVLLISSCSSFGKRDRTSQAPEAEEALPAPVAAPADGTERIDHHKLPPPKKRGFFSRAARAMGGDSNTANVGPCPAVRVLYDSSRFVELDGPEVFANVGFTGEIQNVVSSCRYIGADPIEIGLYVDMAIGRGPKAQGSQRDVGYWVVVTRKDLAPITKQSFVGRVVFPEGSDRVRLVTPEVSVLIPRANAEISGANFEVLVGFELTPAQLEFNRDGKRFRVDAGAPQ